MVNTIALVIALGVVAAGWVFLVKRFSGIRESRYASAVCGALFGALITGAAVLGVCSITGQYHETTVRFVVEAIDRLAQQQDVAVIEKTTRLARAEAATGSSSFDIMAAWASALSREQALEGNR